MKMQSKILKKLQGRNNASAEQRKREFWTEHGIKLTDIEKEVLQSRHEVVHEGHVDPKQTSAELSGNHCRSGVLANLFNRALLAMLGWSGPYLDATELNEPVERPQQAPTSNA